MNKNFITIAGVLLGGSFYMTDSFTENPKLDYYNENLSEKRSVIKNNADIDNNALCIFDSNNNTIISKSVLSSNLNNDTAVLEKFVSSILDNCKSLDHDISKLIDDNFWDLV